MRTIKYKHFTVQCALEEPVTTDNFWKYNLTLRDTNGDYMFTIMKEELCKWHTEALFSGNEKDAQAAIKSLLQNREYWVQLMTDLSKKFEY